MGNKITELYAWIALDPADDNEGMPATDIVIDGMRYFVPLLGADMDRVTSLRRYAKEVKASMPGNVVFRLRRFIITDEVVDEL